MPGRRRRVFFVFKAGGSHDPPALARPGQSPSLFQQFLRLCLFLASSHTKSRLPMVLRTSLCFLGNMRHEKSAEWQFPMLKNILADMRLHLILALSQIIQIGRMNVFLSMAEISSRKHRIAPVPLGTDPLSSTLKADASSVPGFVLFLISSG